MGLDLQALEQELTQVTSVRPIPEANFVHTFVKAYYIPDEGGALLFVKEHTVCSSSEILRRLCVCSGADHQSICEFACSNSFVICAQEYSVVHCRGLLLNGIGSSIKKKDRKELEEKLEKILTFRS